MWVRVGEGGRVGIPLATATDETREQAGGTNDPRPSDPRVRCGSIACTVGWVDVKKQTGPPPAVLTRPNRGGRRRRENTSQHRPLVWNRNKRERNEPVHANPNGEYTRTTSLHRERSIATPGVACKRKNTRERDSKTFQTTKEMHMTPEQQSQLRIQTLQYAECCKTTAKLWRDMMHWKKNHPHEEDKENPAGKSALSSGKKRWTPTPSQLQRMEELFDQGEIITTKDKVHQLLQELQHYGPVTATNIANWFQNKKSRTRRRLLKLHQDGTQDNQ